MDVASHLVEGFPIANHSVSHPDMTTLSYPEQLWQIKTAKARVEAVIGRKMASLFRPPYGAYNDKTRSPRVPRRSSTSCSGIRRLPTRPRCPMRRTSTMRTMQGTNGSIILCHCGPASTCSHHGQGDRRLSGARSRFVTVQQLLGLVPVPATGELLQAPGAGAGLAAAAFPSGMTRITTAVLVQRIAATRLWSIRSGSAPQRDRDGAHHPVAVERQVADELRLPVDSKVMTVVCSSAGDDDLGWAVWVEGFGADAMDRVDGLVADDPLVIDRVVVAEA